MAVNDQDKRTRTFDGKVEEKGVANFTKPTTDILEGQLGPDELPTPEEVDMTREARLPREGN